MRTTDPYGTPRMFEDPAQPPVAPILTDTSGGRGKVTYTPYRVKSPVRCDDCAAAFIHDKNAPHSRPAASKRRQAGTDDLLLCYEHKAMRQARESAQGAK